MTTEKNTLHRVGGYDILNIRERTANRIEGQIRGINGMLDRNTYSDDVLNQISAIQSAPHSVSNILLEEYDEEIEDQGYDVI
jgi:DNA-binding FrmR family transcriptional regulator